LPNGDAECAADSEPDAVAFGGAEGPPAVVTGVANVVLYGIGAAAAALLLLAVVALVLLFRRRG
jgi:hypothetical protein